MKKIKDLWNRNRVLIVLILIVLVCFCIIGVVMVKYFFGGNTSSYGDRLDDIKDLPFKDDDQLSLINAIKENEIVSDVSVNVKGKIIYIRILFSKIEVNIIYILRSIILGIKNLVFIKNNYF